MVFPVSTMAWGEGAADKGVQTPHQSIKGRQGGHGHGEDVGAGADSPPR